MDYRKKAGGLEKFARLDTTVTVIDAFSIFADFETADLLSSRREDVTPEDERTVSDLMVDQIEFADVIVLNKCDMISKKQKESVMTLIRKLNHRAKIVSSPNNSTASRTDMCRSVSLLLVGSQGWRRASSGDIRSRGFGVRR